MKWYLIIGVTVLSLTVGSAWAEETMPQSAAVSPTEDGLQELERLLEQIRETKDSAERLRLVEEYRRKLSDTLTRMSQEVGSGVGGSTLEERPDFRLDERPTPPRRDPGIRSGGPEGRFWEMERHHHVMETSMEKVVQLLERLVGAEESKPTMP